jgi:hypothetical protein
MEEVVLRNFVIIVGVAMTIVLFAAARTPAAQYGTAEEAKAMLDRAVVAVKEDKAKALKVLGSHQPILLGCMASHGKR